MDGSVDAPVLGDMPAPVLEPKARKRFRRWPWLLASGTIISAVALVVTWQHVAQPDRPSFETVAVGWGDVTRQVAATGTVNPELTIIVGSYVSGPITEILCDYNTVVKAGQVCATIDPRSYQTAVNQDSANVSVANAQLQKDRANLDYARLNYERSRRLMGAQAVSQETVDIARNLADQADAQIALDEAIIEQRKAELAAARINLDYTNIRSPVDGVVVSRNVSRGQTVAASFQTPTLFLIATDLTRMQVDTNISESDIGAIRTGQAVTFSVDAFPDRSFRGQVKQVRQSPQTVQNVVTFDAVVSVDNWDLALKPGMTASLIIITDHETDVLRVPSQALRFEPKDALAGRIVPQGPDGNHAHVWVERNSELSMISVKTGISDGSYTAIDDGSLQAGDRVVVAERLPSSDAPASLRFLRW